MTTQNYLNQPGDIMKVPGQTVQPAVTDAPKYWCETCEGAGTIDETLGGEHFSNPKAECPDCDGNGYWTPAASRLPAPVAPSNAQQALSEMEARKDAAYLERNQVVAALAKCFPSGIAKTAIEGWSEDWHGCVYIDLPTGQASWHFHDSQAYLFEGLPAYTGNWDGHDTPEKYRRLAALKPAAPVAPAAADVKGGM